MSVLLHPATDLDPEPEPVRELRAAAGGDPRAWRGLLVRHRRMLLAVTARYRLDSAQREDVLQTTWLKLYENIDRIREPAALRGWLVTTASREAMDAVRRRKREIPTSTVNDTSWTGGVGEGLDDPGRARALHRALAVLTPRERALIEVLLEPETPSYREISRRLDMPIGSIGPIRQRALTRLHATLTNGSGGDVCVPVS